VEIDSRPIAQAILDARWRGVKVTIFLEQDYLRSDLAGNPPKPPTPRAGETAEAGRGVRQAAQAASQADGDRRADRGRFNYTQPANEYNDENIFVMGSTHKEVEGVEVEANASRQLKASPYELRLRRARIRSMATNAMPTVITAIHRAGAPMPATSMTAPMSINATGSR
jgi:hypothetical protein